MRVSVSGDFERAMMDIYWKAKKYNYHATRYLQMLRRWGGQVTAERLLKPRRATDVHGGFYRLAVEENRPELTVEWLVLQDDFKSRFTSLQLNEARARLDRMNPGWRSRIGS